MSWSKMEINEGKILIKALHLFSFGIIFVFLMPQAFAISDQYGISLSPTCLVMLKNNVTTFCPSYEEIMTLFPDTTNPVLGKFQIIDGILQRDRPDLLHPERFYDRQTGSIMWIDPPNEVKKRIKMITIEPSLPAYKNGDESLKMNDYTLSFSKDRYVTPNCGEAKITARDWVFLAGDTMTYLKHNCDPQFTSFDGVIQMTFLKSYQDLATSNKYKLDEMVKIAKEKYKSYHIGNDVISNPAVTEDEDQ